MAAIETVRAFMEALNVSDTDKAGKYLSTQAVLHSPIFSTPFVGKNAVLGLLTQVLKIAETTKIEKMFQTDVDLVSIVRIEMGTEHIDGMNYFRLDDELRIENIKV